MPASESIRESPLFMNLFSCPTFIHTLFTATHDYSWNNSNIFLLFRIFQCSAKRTFHTSNSSQDSGLWMISKVSIVAWHTPGWFSSQVFLINTITQSDRTSPLTSPRTDLKPYCWSRKCLFVAGEISLWTIFLFLSEPFELSIIAMIASTKKVKISKPIFLH